MKSRSHSDDDTYATTVPDINKRLREEQQAEEWLRKAFEELGRAGQATERRLDKLIDRVEALEQQRAEARGMRRMFDWIVRLGLTLLGIFVGQHLQHK